MNGYFMVGKPTLRDKAKFNRVFGSFGAVRVPHSTGVIDFLQNHIGVFIEFCKKYNKII